VKKIVLATSLVIALSSGIALAQSTYPDLGHALYARGYSGSVWVNSFDPAQSYLAHGLFYPDTPINPATGNYEARYGMAVTGSGTVLPDPTTGLAMATGTAINPNAIASDGSVAIDLLSGGNLIDGGSVPFNCPASGVCSWTVHFQTRYALGQTVRVYRHVEGSKCGGELSIDLNGSCRAALISTLHLPAAYTFTSTDNIDTNYVSRVGGTTSALCDIILPICSGVQPPPPQVPVSNFGWSPASVYPNTPVTFTDQSSNGPTGWSWAFQNGSPSSATVANPVVSFSSAGSKTVTLQASNVQGAGNVVPKTVVVLDPSPAGTLSASSANPTQCQAETFTANVTGAPPLTYTWQVLDPNGATLNPPGVVTGGTTFAWTPLPALAPGTYIGQLRVKNSSNSDGLVLRQAVQLTALPALTDISRSAPTTNAFVANTVQLTAPAFSGATQVVWDYGDDHTDTFTDPVAGRNPSHTYAASGTYNAKVTISNCVNPNGSTSQTVSVVVTQTTVLLASFQPSLFCQFGSCFATTGVPVVFVDSSTGAELWDYDWDHTALGTETCNFTDAGHTSPVTTHTYTTTGTFVPCLRVRRGTDEQSVVASTVISVTNNTNPPAIAVSGSTSGLTNQPYTFFGSASNCTPTSAGWSWSVGGGTISGASTGSSILVSWTTTGSKTVSATNSSCSGAQGSASIALSANNGSTVAQFTVSPSAPKAGDTVAFDSSSSTNVPSGATIGWSFGDGSSGASGSTATHVYASAGSYNVQLSITPAACLNSSCISSAAKTVTVAPATTGGSLQAQFTVSPAAPKAGDTVTFDSSSSTNVPSGASISWGFGDGSSASGATATHVYAAAGSYSAQLTVASAGCVSTSCQSSATKTVTVAPVVTGPQTGAQFTVSPVGPTSGDAVSFDASASTNVPAGSQFGWSFGDGSATGFGTVVLHTYASPGTYNVTLGIAPPGCGVTTCLMLASKTIVVILGNGVHVTVSPASPTSGDVVTFDASSSTSAPAGSQFGWSFGDGSATVFGTVVVHTFASPGNYNVVLAVAPPGCTAAGCLLLASRTVIVAQGNGVHFTVSPASPSATQAATFDASSSTSIAAGSQLGWSFGDGSAAAFGTVVLHAFASPGSYSVVLAVQPPGCTVASCLKLASQTVVVGPAPPVSADFASDGTCNSDQCQAQATTPVTLTASAADATTFAWDFGDGTNGAGRQVSHAWAQVGTYTVSLTVVKGAAAATKTRSFVVTAPPPPVTKTMLLPLVTESRGVLVQSNDLYVYNPGTSPLDVTLQFRKRGTPDVNPPQVTTTLQPGATMFSPDVLSSLFNVENVAGFITVLTGVGSVEPVVTSFNSQGATASKVFGLTIPGTSVGSLGSASSSGPVSSLQHLVGLNDTPDRQSSLGFSNPTDETATYHLRFFDKTGRLLAESPDLTLSGHDQRQFSTQEIRDTFGVTNLDDYRVEVSNVSGAQVFPFGSDVRVVTGDPSFTEAGTYTLPRLYLLGVFTGAGAAKTTWQTDLLLSNVSDQVLQTTMTYTAVSNKSNVRPAQLTLQPGTTERLVNALFSQFGLRSGTGVVTLTSTSPGSIFPIARAESYDNTNPAKRYGQSLLALRDADAADTTKKEVLVGLRQDGSNKTTLWLLNPSGTAGVYDVVYRGLNGAVLGTLAGVKIGAGQVHQISPNQHPLKKTGVPGGFTVEVVVRSGRALAAAEVVRAGSNDPIFVAPVVR
jgi:PKD repeat protein